MKIRPTPLAPPCRAVRCEPPHVYQSRADGEPEAADPEASLRVALGQKPVPWRPEFETSTDGTHTHIVGSGCCEVSPQDPVTASEATERIAEAAAGRLGRDPFEHDGEAVRWFGRLWG